MESVTHNAGLNRTSGTSIRARMLPLTAALLVGWAVLLCVMGVFEAFASTGDIPRPVSPWEEATRLGLFVIPILAGALVTGWCEPKEDPRMTSWTPLLAVVGGLVAHWLNILVQAQWQLMFSPLDASQITAYQDEAGTLATFAFITISVTGVVLGGLGYALWGLLSRLRLHFHLG